MSRSVGKKGEGKTPKPNRRGGRPRKADAAATAQVAALYANGTDPAPEQLASTKLPATIGYSEQLMEAIMQQVSAGKSIEALSAQQGMPHFTSIYRWIDGSEVWSQRYKIANQLRARTRAEQAETQVDIMLRDDDPKRALMYESRVRTLTRLAALGDPMKYSDKMLHMHHHTGELAVKLEFDLGQKVVQGTQQAQDIEDISGS